MPEQKENSVLAWSGWRMQVPSQWRPLRITGDWDAGKMMIGDMGRALLQVQWTHPNPRRFDPDNWLRKKLHKAGPGAGGLKPANESFPASAFVPSSGASSRGDRALWYGYAPEENLAIELIANIADSPRHKLHLTGKIVPSLEAEAARQPTHWALFGSSFLAPADFYYTRCNLKLGDMALEFLDWNRRRLMLRQLYPAKLALSRRELSRWMEIRPFSTRRKNRTLHLEDYSHNRLEGKLRSATLNIAPPLGFVRPLWSMAIGLVDPRLDRILVAEMLAPDPEALDLKELEEAIDGMNWALDQESAA
jgi:hypothetical protein